MKKLIAYCFCLCFAAHAYPQYFLRGTVHDEKNIALQSVKIYLHSSKAQFRSDNDGSFGISCNALYDSITVSQDGYEPQTLRVKTDTWQNILLKPSADAVFRNRPKLISFTKDRRNRSRYNPFVSDETYFKLVENEYVKADQYPNTGFSLNVNKAAYSNVRRFINQESRVPPDAVRIEELLNYFNLGYDPPPGNNTFNVSTNLAPCPWNAKERLLFLNVCAKKLDLYKKPPGNFVFLIDVSGSMDMPNRLGLLKAAFQLFIKNLRPVDKISIVTYGGTVGIWLSPTPGSEQKQISNAIELLTAAGDTPGSEAIQAAYKLARNSFIPGGNNRVIIATDGDFNVGQVSEKELDELITKERQSGVYLTCLGVGMGNFKDSKLQTLAKRGNGNYAYLDDLHEAEKVLVYELTETLYAVANDAYINVEFDPAKVSAYRLVGFDNKKEAVQDESSDLDGGEIGSGSSTMAVFQIMPAEGMEFTDSTSGNLGMLNLKYTDAGDSLNCQQDISVPITARMNSHPDSCTRFATAVVMYGMKLRESPYLNKASWSDVKNAAEISADKNNYLQNDFLTLVNKTVAIYAPGKIKKGRRKDRDKDL